ncbi:YbaB/EbfC family nucleoid-associated protein [Nocardia sp. NBC_01388]|uniref:YbaB/EbfC family nucleoid-associated protein n=1 Tax=Nocardia sp. NBC_01388 TaxID=2903596 RepID=UPI00324DE13C
MKWGVLPMDRWKRESLRSADNGLRDQIEDTVDAYERQQSELAELFHHLDTARVQADSADKLVEIVADGAGEIVEVRLTAAAMRTAPEQLGRSIVEAARAATRLAQQQTAARAAVITAGLESLPDLPDLASEAPSLHDIRALFRRDGDPPGPAPVS